ncbi:MAG TPA: acyl-CoA dehydrogenase family protein [Acetobacteraceae bacterium]|nr:acyl-CoA dehydrogenase family protein [Acetobacteraceae bacterium]
MDFDDTPEEAAFRAEARAFLNANAARKQRSSGAHRYGDTDAEDVAHAKAWQAKKADAGFAGITWPKEWGGRAGTPMQQIIWNQEEAEYEVPPNIFLIGLGMCIPTMIAYARPGQLQRYVHPALRGDEIWCQLFSEPSGGSDVAGLRTRAEKRGDEWVINGQKIWTSGAHYSNYGLLLTRSDPNVPKHAGLTAFFIDMKSPGIEVRPIHQMSGASNFNEVFFTDLRVPDAQRLGAPGAGWKVAITTLMNERLAASESRRPDMQDLIELARGVEIDGRPAIADPAVREHIAEWHAQNAGLMYTRCRVLTALSRGQTPGPENSIFKLVSASKQQAISAFGMDLLGMAGGVMDPELAPMHAMFQESLLSAPGMRIAGGSDEILRNIIAERVLGLPGDVRVDKDVAFNQLPSGSR